MSRLLFALLAAVALFAAACGDDATTTGTGGTARAVEIEMVDTAFRPDAVEVQAGEAVRFVFRNRGDVAHDAFVGDATAHREHEMEMREMEEDGHGAHGGGDDGITVDPGETGELTHTFDQPGTYEIACHQPGHYPAGMKVTVTVTRGGG